MTAWFPEAVPTSIAVHIGPLTLYWYGLFMVVALIAGYTLARVRYRHAGRSLQELLDVFFCMVIGGLIGARLWHVFVFQWPYYAENPLEIVKVWHGGIAIQGALLGGALALWLYVKVKKVPFAVVADLLVPSVALGQVIGRWGNFFNQELYGSPTALPWGIFISPEQRIPGYQSFSRFHPAFFYESITSLALLVVLLLLSRKMQKPGVTTIAYLFGYSAIRFCVDFLRIDPMPVVAGLRLSQVIALFVMAACIVVFGTLIRTRGIAKQQ